MPIRKRWSSFTLGNIQLVPQDSGVYELGDAKGEVVYIGSSGTGQYIRGRLYFHKKHKSSSVKSFRFELAGILQFPKDMENHYCELFKAKYGRLPKLQKRMPKGYLPFW